MGTSEFNAGGNPVMDQHPILGGVEMGDSRKYPYLYHGRLLGFPKGRGGFTIMEF